MSMKKNTKKGKGQQELNPLVAIGIVAVVVGGAGYYLFAGDSDSSTSADSSYSSGYNAAAPTKTIIENVEAPDAKNAPIILPAKVTNLEVFNNNISDKQHKVFESKLDTELAQSNLVLKQIQEKEVQVTKASKGSADSDMYNDFGMQTGYTPSSNYGQSQTVSHTQSHTDKNVVSTINSNHVDVSMTTVINGKPLAVVKSHDEYKTVGVNNYVNNNMKVKSISDHKVCFVVTGSGKAKTTCVAV